MTSLRRRSHAERALIAIAFGCAVAVLSYALLHAVEWAFFPQMNPAILILSEQSGFVWRSIIAAYLGGMGVFGGYALASRSLELAARWLVRALWIAAAALLVQGALFP